MSELMFQRRMSGVEDLNLSKCLHMAVCFQGGTAEMVQQLVDAKADVNEQLRQPTFSFFGVALQFHSCKFRFGKAARPGKGQVFINIETGNANCRPFGFCYKGSLNYELN